MNKDRWKCSRAVVRIIGMISYCSITNCKRGPQHQLEVVLQTNCEDSCTLNYSAGSIIYKVTAVRKAQMIPQINPLIYFVGGNKNKE